MPDAPSASPRWRRRAQARPEEILQAASALFLEKGFAATRLTEIARRAGVTKATLYHYFSGKEALFKQVMEQAIAPSLADAEALVARHEGSMAELLGQLIWAWWEKVREPPFSGLHRLMIAEGHQFPELAQFYLDEVVTRARRITAGVLERGIAAGEFRAVDPEWAARELTIPLIFAATWMHSLDFYERQRFDYDDYIHTHLDIVLAGIRAGGAQ